MSDFQNESLLNEAVSAHGLKTVTQLLSNISPLKKTDCHEPAHRLGRLSYGLLGNFAFRDCGIECHSGCIHGAMEAFFAEKGTANLSENLDILCSSELNGFFSHQCFHGVGHGLMAWSDYELYDALNACDLLPIQYNRISCYGGVFMENIVGGLSDESKINQGHFSKYLSNDFHYPCNAVEEKYAGACYFLQTSRMMGLSGVNFTKISQECSKAPLKFQRECFQSMGRDVSGYFRNPQKSIQTCRTISDSAQMNNCITGALADQFWDASQSENALQFCRALEGSDMEKSCYQSITMRANYVILDNDKKKEFCKQVPLKHQSGCSVAKPSILIPSVAGRGNIQEKKNDSSLALSEEIKIYFKNSSFSPREIKIGVGQKVTWINQDTKRMWPASNIHPTHEIYPQFDPQSPISPGGNWSFVFEKAGFWRFHDHLTPSAIGSITVE